MGHSVAAFAMELLVQVGSRINPKKKHSIMSIKPQQIKHHTALQMLRKKQVDINYQIMSCRERVADVEWAIDSEDGDINKLLDDRRKALDKIRWLSKDQMQIELDIIALDDVLFT